MDDDGFYMGELDGIRGLVPSNFLTDAPDDYGEGGTSAQRGGHRGGRGHGPGARGPPPPPRNDPAHNRRKGQLLLFKFLFFVFICRTSEAPLLNREMAHSYTVNVSFS